MAETTNSLLKKIVNGKDFPKILETNKDAFEELPVSEYLRRLCEERDKLIQIAFGFGLTLEETQNLLKSAGKSVLHPKSKRDAAIIFGISHHMDMMEMQYLLTSIEVPLLGEG